MDFALLFRGFNSGPSKPDTGPRVLVAKNGPLTYSETFIRDHVETIPAAATWFRKVGLSDSRRMVEHIVRQGLQVVLAEYATTGTRIAPICRASGLPLVTYVHGYDVFRRSTVQRDRAAWPTLFCTSQFVIAASKSIAMRLLEIGAPASKIVHIPCVAVDTGLRVDGPNGNLKTFLYIGRFVPKKAPDAVIRAFLRASNDRSDCRLLMLGDGEMWQGCRDFVARAGARDKVLLPGRASRCRVREAMRTSFAFVNHSVPASDGDMEGTPVTIFEAARAGLPILASRHAGIEDILTEQTGCLVEPKDNEGLERGFRKLIEEPLYASDLAAATQTQFEFMNSVAILRSVLAEAARRG